MMPAVMSSRKHQSRAFAQSGSSFATLTGAQRVRLDRNLAKGRSHRGRKKLRRTIWVECRENFSNGLGLKAHGGLGTRVDTGFDHSTYYPVLVSGPDRGEYDTQNGDKIGNE